MVQFTPSAVQQVRELLLTRVPYELVDIIMTEARYWARHLTKRDVHLRVQTTQDSLHNAKWLYMLSDPIPSVYHEGRRASTKVHSVQFSMRSCDQGWGGFSEDKNTYSNSYTWFEASIFRPDGDEASKPQPQWVEEANVQPINFNKVPDGSSWTELLSPYKRKNKRWLVQMNVQASRHIRRHDVKWDREAAEEGQIMKSEYDERSGCGRGLGFVRTLQAGDRIALIARAFYPGWENNVYAAEIEIAYQV